MPHSSQLGFFMNPSRYMRTGSMHPSCEALMNATYLWGSVLSTSSALRARESYFAERATQAVSSMTLTPLLTGQSQIVICTIQAEILLAQYFFTSGRLLEGRYHCLAAVALVTGSQLHQLDVAALSADPVSAGERIRAFWTVLALDKIWAAAMNTPPSICQNGRSRISVTTPWPLATEAYDQVRDFCFAIEDKSHWHFQGMLVQPRGGNYTLEDFLRGTIDDSNEDFSRLAIRTKACALYEQAIYVASQFRPGKYKDPRPYPIPIPIPLPRVTALNSNRLRFTLSRYVKPQ